MAAESEITWYSQKQLFPEDLMTLQNKFSVKSKSQLYKLDLILQEGIFRVRGTNPLCCKKLNIQLSSQDKRRIIILILQDALENKRTLWAQLHVIKLENKKWLPEDHLLPDKQKNIR